MDYYVKSGFLADQQVRVYRTPFIASSAHDWKRIATDAQRSSILEVLGQIYFIRRRTFAITSGYYGLLCATAEQYIPDSGQSSSE